MSNLHLPSIGERAFICGQTGSGKTAFAVWTLRRLDYGPVIIYDTKEEEKFPALPKSVVVHDFDKIKEYMNDEEFDYIVFRPSSSDLTDSNRLDDYLHRHYAEYQHSVAYIDEIYSFHNNGRAGKGLIALLTRGRSRGITTIMSTQRPAWISRFTVTETQLFYIFRLVDRKDALRLSDVIPGFDRLPKLKPYYFYFYRTGEDHPRLFAPITLDKGQDTGYTDKVPSKIVKWI